MTVRNQTILSKLTVCRPLRKARTAWAFRLWAPAASSGLALIFTLAAVQAKGPAPFQFSLGPASNHIADHDKDKTPKDFVPPTVQAAGPDAASIQSSVDAFRAALGNPSNGNAGPLTSGHREINWDGATPTDVTTAPVTPFDVFLNTRGSQFTTPGIGLSQAPPSGGPQGGLAVLFNNPTYATAFKAFSPFRLFTPVGSNITDAFFFLPGSNGNIQNEKSSNSRRYAPGEQTTQEQIKMRPQQDGRVAVKRRPPHIVACPPTLILVTTKYRRFVGIGSPSSHSMCPLSQQISTFSIISEG